MGFSCLSVHFSYTRRYRIFLLWDTSFVRYIHITSCNWSSYFLCSVGSSGRYWSITLNANKDGVILMLCTSRLSRQRRSDSEISCHIRSQGNLWPCAMRSSTSHFFSILWIWFFRLDIRNSTKQKSGSIGHFMILAPMSKKSSIKAFDNILLYVLSTYHIYISSVEVTSCCTRENLL